MRACSLVFFLLVCTTVFGQTTFNADSVEKIFNALPDSIKIREANKLMQYYMDADFKKSMHYARQAFALTEKIDNKKDIAYTYISWAIAQYNFGKYDSCLYYNLEALKIYQSLRDTVKMAVAYNNISGAYNALGDQSASAYYSYKAYTIYKARKNWRKVAIACLNLSSSFFESGDYKSTLLWSRRAYEYYQQAQQPAEFGYAIQVFIDVYIARKQIDSASVYLREMHQLNRQYPNEYLETISLSQRGEVYALQGKYDSAILMAKQCINFYETLDMPESVFQTRLSIARAYMATQQWEEALRHAREAHATSMRIKSKQMIVKSSIVLSDFYKARHQLDKALEYASLASVYKDSIMQQSLRGSIEGRFFDVKLEEETQEKLQAIQKLEQREAVIGTQWVVIALITTGLCIMVVIAYLIRRVGRYRKKLNTQLSTNNQRLSELNHEINGLVNTIVHDLKSPLHSVQGILSIIQRSVDNTPETTELIGLANKSLNNGHEIIRQLLELREEEDNPSQLKLSEITAQEVMEDMQGSFAATARQKNITLSTDYKECRFVSDKILLLRVLNNLVSNALKFSGPQTEVKIVLKQENQHVVIEVSDQGPGFRPEDMDKIYGKFQKLSARPTAGENSNGLGLATVHLLVKHLQGTIALQTQQGKGSVFTVTLQKEIGI